MTALAALLNSVLDPFLTLLYPPRCLVCRTLGESGLCAACAAQIAPVAAPFCCTCGHPLAPDGPCFNCAVRRPAYRPAPAPWAHMTAFCEPPSTISSIATGPQLAVPLGRRLAGFARDNAPALNNLQFDALLPVPMHPVRQRLRGYNQSERLARVVGAELGLPLLTRALARTRPTRPQVGLTGDARRGNLLGAFAVRQPEAVAGKTLLLVDDVATTGASLSECAAALKAAGAKAVYALTLAAG